MPKYSRFQEFLNRFRNLREKNRRSAPIKPAKPGVDFEVGSIPTGRRFPGFTQPGGGFEIGRPAVVYDNRATIPEADMYERWSRKGKAPYSKPVTRPGGGRHDHYRQPTEKRKSKFDGLKGDALIQARKEHQAKLKAHNERVNKLAKNF